MVLFRDRREAGRRLAQAVQRRAPAPDTVVLALPRGGVPVAYEVATALHAPLDIFLVRKLGVPGQEELAFGAIASGGVRVLNEEVVALLGLGPDWIEQVAEREARELARRERAYRGDRPPVSLAGRPVVVIDDGLATGASMQAAVEGLRPLGPTHLTVAVPVAAEETCRRLARLVDDVVCAATPWPFYGVGAWYEDFRQTTDEAVRRLLEATAAVAAPPGPEET